MKKVKLGKTNIEITQIGMGNVDFGTKIIEKDAFKILDHFLEAGGNFIDTSNNYAVWNSFGAGECEKVIGNWMKSRDNREEIILATKVGANPKKKEDVIDQNGNLFPDWPLRGEGLSRDAINNAITGSLERLQTDYIDLYYAHVEDRSTPLEETMETFNDLKEKNLVRAVGCSNHRAWRIERANNICKENNWEPFSCVQSFNTYLRPFMLKRFGYVDFELQDYILANPHLNLIAYTPTLWGKYSKMHIHKGKEFWEDFYSLETENRLNVLTQMAQKHKCNEIQIVYAWLVQNSPPSIPLVATSSIDHLNEDIDALDIKLSQEDLKILNETSV